MRALVTGATGFIGRALVQRLAKPIILTRDVGKARMAFPTADVYPWDPSKEPAPEVAFRGVDVVFNLAGEPVASGRWNPTKKQAIRDSRITGTANLIAGMQAVAERPKVLVSASAVGYYGDRRDELLYETSQAGDDFLAGVCVDWEQAAAPASELGLRVVQPRIGIVLGRGGGALAKMLTPFRWGVGGRLGTGAQWMPWIHLDDVVGLLLHAAESPAVCGPLNATAPKPVTNRDFTREIARALRRPALFPVPGPALRLAVGEFANILLASNRVIPRVAQQTGFDYRYPALDGALRAILRGEEQPALVAG